MLYLKIERWKMKGIMDERERLAQEMHDTLAQSFAGVGFHLQGVRNHMRNLSLVEKPDHLLEKLDTACKIVAQTHREASANIAALHPDADGGSDLLVALERYVASMLNAADLPIEVKRIGEVRETSLPVRDALFQVGREALTNVVRHSRSEQVFLTMRYEQNTVALEVRDNGAVFDIDSESGFGIFAMRRRCERIGAELCINSTLGKGTTVTITSSYGRNHSITAWLKHMWNQKIFSHRSSTQSQNKGINRPLH
jgi:signal transduction histidine kinase